LDGIRHDTEVRQEQLAQAALSLITTQGLKGLSLDSRRQDGANRANYMLEADTTHARFQEKIRATGRILSKGVTKKSRDPGVPSADRDVDGGPGEEPVSLRSVRTAGKSAEIFLYTSQQAPGKH